MKHQSSKSLSFLTLIIFILIFSLVKLTTSLNEHSPDCTQPFTCGDFKNLTYPFWGENRPPHCGLSELELYCNTNEDVPFTAINISSQLYRVLAIDIQAQKLTVARADYWDNICPPALINTNIDTNLFDYVLTPFFLSFAYGCPNTTSIQHDFPGHNSCGINGSRINVFFRYGSSNYADKLGCSVVNIPILEAIPPGQEFNINVIKTALREGFQLKWKANYDQCKSCEAKGGQCGHEPCQNKFKCFSPDQTYNSSECLTRPAAGRRHSLPKSMIVILVGMRTCFGVYISFTISKSTTRDWILKCGTACCFMTKIKPTKHVKSLTIIFLLPLIVASILGTGIGICALIALILYCKRKFPSERRQDVEVLLEEHGSLGPKRYTYSDLKRITNFFKDKLGEGGYGVVYRGQLHDGHQVAVKILKKSSNEDMEEFINEVASIEKTSHVNIVKLLGFCYEGGQKRALVYNYMPNGSLEKFTYRGQKKHQLLSWEKLFDIVVGVARGLEYLHVGCDTRILHFDIKPQNILLDENFCPKISDFGLAKSCQQKDSIISMSEARGTIGYIAPEVFFKQMGGVSHKSDVYSFGMLVLEMVGCRNNADASVESRSEQYFPEWIYRQLDQVELDQQEGILNVEEESLRRKMILVSLWCIQTHPTTRPNMSRVVEMLGGSLKSLQIPPMPSLVHPFTSQQNSSTISVGRLFQE